MFIFIRIDNEILLLARHGCQELCGDYEHRWTLQQLPLQICWLVLRIKRLTVGGRATKVITKSISQYLVSDKS